ncbi:DUF5937 family protein [Streptomyces sp. NPDC056883]|uniref:DUF5937 family protein n=1 Tax=Streptomyces sp. NPDC056883 TaxID=3345959 RepID=UPI0036AE702B
MAPYWPRIQMHLEADIHYRARRFAEDGTHSLFEDFAPQLAWSSGTLKVEHRFLRGVRRLDGRGLLLVPSAFVWPRVFATTDAVYQPTLRYPPRGIGTLWEAPPGSASAALSRVLGRSRARLLAELTAPAATTARPRRSHLLRPGPPDPSAATTGCATSRTSSPPSPTARCASASTWTYVVAGPAPASDTVFLYGCHNGCDAPHRR